MHWRTKLDVAAASGVTLASQSDRGYSACSASASSICSDSFGMRAEYEIYQNVGNDSTTSETNINVLSVSGLLRF